MTDEEAVELLRLLAVYYEMEDEPPVPRSLTVAELAGDLIDSTPVLLIDSDLRRRLVEKGLDVDAIRRIHPGSTFGTSRAVQP